MKKRNPYRVAVDTINRFRGLWQKASRANIDKAYTPVDINAVSHKIGQLNNREGHDYRTAYPSAINNGGRLNTVKFIGEGNNIHAEAIAPVAIYGIPSYNPPSSWNPPPWQNGNDPVYTCEDWWNFSNTPVENQKVGGVIPDCFVSTAMTCQEFWDRNSIPNEFRKAGGIYPDCMQGISIPPATQRTCQDYWDYAPSMAAYEVASQANVVVGTDVSSCWELTCEDLWSQYPTYSAYEVSANADLEMKETGGTGKMSDCWNITLNCEALYADNPQWDPYRLKGGVFPNCWDFTTDPITPTCLDFWTQYNTPEQYQRIGGVYPNCITIPEVTIPTRDTCRRFIWYWPTGGDSITWDIEEGYAEEDTKTLMDFETELSVPTGSIPTSLTISNITGPINISQWFYDYVNTDPPCRKLIAYGTNVTVEEGLTEGEYEGGFNMDVRFAGIGTLRFPVTVTINVSEGMSWQSLYDTYNQRRQMVEDTALPAFETYDFTDYDTQVSFVAEAQTWCKAIQSVANPLSTGYKFLTTADKTALEAVTYTEACLDWEDNIKTLAGLTTDFTRKYYVGEVLTTAYGTLQDGDVVDAYLFTDLDAVFRTMKVLSQGIKASRKGNGKNLIEVNAASGYFTRSSYRSPFPYTEWLHTGDNNQEYILANSDFFITQYNADSTSGALNFPLQAHVVPSTVDLYFAGSKTSVDAMNAVGMTTNITFATPAASGFYYRQQVSGITVGTISTTFYVDGRVWDTSPAFVSFYAEAICSYEESELEQVL